MSAALSSILAEARRASHAECRAYLHGAMRDGTFNHLHGTIRIAQADLRWLKVLGVVIERMGSKSWIYREGGRRVWVIESTCRLGALDLASPLQSAAFVRGYFDAEGGVPHETRSARLYIQITQKDRHDLGRVRGVLDLLGIRCGQLHNPSVRAEAAIVTMSWAAYNRRGSCRSYRAGLRWR